MTPLLRVRNELAIACGGLAETTCRHDDGLLGYVVYDLRG